MDKYRQRARLACELRDAAQELGFMYAAYTDGDRMDASPRFDEIVRQSLVVRDLQKKLRDLA